MYDIANHETPISGRRQRIRMSSFEVQINAVCQELQGVKTSGKKDDGEACQTRS